MKHLHYVLVRAGSIPNAIKEITLFLDDLDDSYSVGYIGGIFQINGEERIEKYSENASWSLYDICLANVSNVELFNKICLEIEKVKQRYIQTAKKQTEFITKFLENIDESDNTIEKFSDSLDIKNIISRACDAIFAEKVFGITLLNAFDLMEFGVTDIGGTRDSISGEYINTNIYLAMITL